MKIILRNYEETTGQLINNLKSSFSCTVATSKVRCQIIKSATSFMETKLPIKYLGFPLFTGRKKSTLFAAVEELIAQKIKGWYGNLISHSGRLVLLRSVLQSMTFHIFCVLDPPVAVIHWLERMFATFVWGKSEDKSKHKWVPYFVLCLPYAEGGVALKSFADIMSAHSCKLWSLFYKGEGI